MTPLYPTNGISSATYGVAELLGNPLPVKYWTNNIDANTLAPGIVYCGENSVNVPESYCVILTMGKNQIAQIAVATQSNNTYCRCNKDKWKSL